jgi:hypothetical protein
MQIVMHKLGNMFQRNGDMDFCIGWLMTSFDLMEIDGKRVYSGLYSGWRGTTWINTVLNHCYIQTAELSFQRKFGHKALEGYDGVGDDVDSKVAEVQIAYQFFEVMKDMGYEDNETKQLVTKEMHEFLRTVFTEDGVYTCINRVLPGYVCGDLERGGANAEERIRSNYVNIYSLHKRGLSEDIVTVLELMNVARWGRVPQANKQGYREMSPCVLHGREEDGGLGIPDVENRIWKLEVPVPRRVMDDVTMRSRHYDLTREEIYAKIDELSRLGCVKRDLTESEIQEFAIGSHDFDSLTKAMIDYVGSEGFEKYWSHSCNVIEKEEYKEEYDQDMLMMWMVHCRTVDYDKSMGVINKYAGLKSYLPFTRSSNMDLAALLVDEPENLMRADGLKFDVRVVTRAPEWFVSAVLKYFKHMILIGDMTSRQAKRIGETLICTYKKLYRKIRM